MIMLPKTATPLVLVLTVVNLCMANYLKYEVDPKMCDTPPIAISSLNESVVLESSQTMAKKCMVRVERPQDAEGLVVVPQNVSIDNAIRGGCENYIRFGSSEATKWCQSSDAKSLIFGGNHTLDIEFNLDNNSDYNFIFVITPYRKSLSGEGIHGEQCGLSTAFMCRDQQICIPDIFRCDGRHNCPEGYDENDCSMKVPITERSVTENMTSMTEETTYETSSAAEITTSELTSSTVFETTVPTETTTQVPEAGIKWTLNLDDVNYQTYKIIDFCNRSAVDQIPVIELAPGSNGTAIPAILELTPEEARRLNNKTCSLRFSMPSSSFFDEKGLIVGIDSLNLTSDSCKDYIEIDVSGQVSNKWCKSNKTDHNGQGHKGEGQYLDVKFHSANNTNSSFTLVVTQYQGKMMGFCPSSGYLKCTRSNNECVSKTFVCDGHRNCPSGEDEDNCPEPAPTPTPTPVPTTTQKPTTTSRPTTTTSRPTTTTGPTTTTSPPTTSTSTPTTTINPNTTTTTVRPTSTTSATPTTTGKPTTTPTPTPSPQPSTSTTPPSPTPSPGPSGGTIALIVIGILVVIGVIVCVLVMVRRRRHNVNYSPLN